MAEKNLPIKFFQKRQKDEMDTEGGGGGKLPKWANPELIVEIQSHTDSKGNENYNVKLSQKRAESIVTYLTQKGISIKRLVAKGYGENKPIAPNDLPNGSDNPEGRAKNRRTDFKIIGKLDVEVINDAEVD